MMNEEMKKVYDSITCMDDAYELVCQNGFKGSKQDFGALVKKAAEAMETEEMDLDDMEQVAGGGIGDAWDKVTNWVSDNPLLTAEIVGTVAVTSAAVYYSVSAYNSYKKARDAYTDTQDHSKINANGYITSKQLETRKDLQEFGTDLWITPSDSKLYKVENNNLYYWQ